MGPACIASWALAALAACAPTSGWRTTDVRACHDGDAAHLCVSGDPDPGVEVRVGDTVVLPGECVVAPRSARDRGRGGSVKLGIRGPQGERNARVRAPAGRMTVVAVAEDGTISSRTRHACDGTPVR